MTLITTAGSSSATSIASLADAESYMATIQTGYKSAWISAADTNKESALVQASRLLYSLPWIGSRANQTQTMCWPRIASRAGYGFGYGSFGWLQDADGYPIDSTTIPDQIVQACCEFAFRLLSEDRTADAGGLIRFGGSLGPIKDAYRIERRPIPASVLDMVSPLLTSDPRNGGLMVRS